MNQYSLFLQSGDLSSALVLLEEFIIGCSGGWRCEFWLCKKASTAKWMCLRGQMMLRQYWMLDTGYGSTAIGRLRPRARQGELAEAWISRNAPLVKSKNIKDPACRGEALKERRLESSIQDHVVFPIAFIKTP